MSCNGCRVLRKGCNENCILRQSLSTIETAQAQANATLFVAKFFGRAGLLSFLSAVPEYQRPALFESLLLEACGRTVNPVNGAVGLVCTGKWQLCLSAVATVLRGGSIGPMQLVTDHGSPINAKINCRSLIPDDHQDLQPLLITTKGNSHDDRWTKKRRTTAASFELSETTTLESANDSASSETKLLHLFF